MSFDCCIWREGGSQHLCVTFDVCFICGVWVNIKLQGLGWFLSRCFVLGASQVLMVFCLENFGLLVYVLCSWFSHIVLLFLRLFFCLFGIRYCSYYELCRLFKD